MALTGCNNCLPTRPASRAILTRNRRADSVAMSFMICTWRDQSWLQPVRSIGTLAQDQCVELDSTCCVVFSSELSLTWMRQCHTLQCSTRSAKLSSASFARLDLLHFTAPRGSDEPRGATFEVTAQPEKVTHPMPSSAHSAERNISQIGSECWDINTSLQDCAVTCCTSQVSTLLGQSSSLEGPYILSFSLLTFFA